MLTHHGCLPCVYVRQHGNSSEPAPLLLVLAPSSDSVTHRQIHHSLNLQPKGRAPDGQHRLPVHLS